MNINDLERLNKERTQGEWDFDKDSWDIVNEQEYIFRNVYSIPTSEFVVYLANHTDEIIKRLRESRKVIERLTQVNPYTDDGKLKNELDEILNNFRESFD